ncbi:hypothetical protein DIURU_002099 [Diutina rugosa]|uniref:DNA-directed RNA polymerase III subunit n=1 Tax=Diutina rugosa TaxID=5481 RepID=A0A642UYF3_DIURU|nr:uncharacterized protein DIURU_002099 [Diutina rugosa]KAA8904147.1 hypothetical protein DIURU_002099 [Diutina rugosa]
MSGGFRKNRVLLPFGLDYADIQSNGGEEASVVLPVNGAPRAAEIGPAQQQIAFTRLMAEGAFFTTDDNAATATQPDGIERYQDRYTKTRKVARTIDDHPFAIEMFPQELYSVMGVSKKKLLAVSKYTSANGLGYSKSGADEAAAMLERLKSLADVDEGKGDDEDGEEENEEDADDNYDDEDDDDDDYNAEKYFDDGDDDGGNDDDGGEAAF